jgi:hypothetical protein
LYLCIYHVNANHINGVTFSSNAWPDTKNLVCVGNIVVIDVKYKDCKMEIVGNIVFVFSMLSLDTLYLKEFLLWIPSSNGRIGYMIENIILIPFQMVYDTPSKSKGTRRYERFSQVNPSRKYRSTQLVLQVSPISECINTINT